MIDAVPLIAVGVGLAFGFLRRLNFALASLLAYGASIFVPSIALAFLSILTGIDPLASFSGAAYFFVMSFFYNVLVCLLAVLSCVAARMSTELLTLPQE